MKAIVQKTLTALQTSSELKSEPLVKMLIDSTQKSISLGESFESIYSNLKSGIIAVNERLDKAELTAILENLDKSEETLDSKIITLAKAVNLGKYLTTLTESDLYKNPIAKTQIDAFSKSINSGVVDFSLCEQFIATFEKHSSDPVAIECVDAVRKYLVENRSTLAMLHTIYQMESLNTPIYAGATTDLKNMLVTESYSADIIKLKYKNTIPRVTKLISDLRVLESAETGNFTLGEGNSDTLVSNVIAPSTPTDSGFITYIDDRFISVRESKKLIGNETSVKIDGRYKISEITPDYVKVNHEAFYNLCEAFATLGFKPREDGNGVTSTNIPKLKLELILNEAKGLDLYVNDHKSDTNKIENVSESLTLQSAQTKARVKSLIDNLKEVCNLEFIKTVHNHRRLTEAVVFNLNTSYFVCEKVNAADRKWSQVDEAQLYEYFVNNFNYDISAIFKTEVEQAILEAKTIATKKEAIQANLTKLEESVAKLKAACSESGLDRSEVAKLEKIQESTEQIIHSLKQEYIKLDLLKKKIV